MLACCVTAVKICRFTFYTPLVKVLAEGSDCQPNQAMKQDVYQCAIAAMKLMVGPVCMMQMLVAQLCNSSMQA